MSTPDLSAFHIRKWYLQIEDTLAGETGAPADGEPLRKIVLAACLRNPFAGKFVQDLSPWINPSPELGKEFGRRIQEAAQGREIQSYGKACLVGIDGEYEHGNALLTNPAANPIRAALGGAKSWVHPPASAAAPARSSTFRWHTGTRCMSGRTTTPSPRSSAMRRIATKSC